MARSLWALVEIYIYITVGGNADNISVVVLDESGGSSASTVRLDVARAFEEVDIGLARCSIGSEYQALLAAIEVGFGTHGEFAHWFHDLFRQHAGIDSASRMHPTALRFADGALERQFILRRRSTPWQIHCTVAGCVALSEAAALPPYTAFPDGVLVSGLALAFQVLETATCSGLLLSWLPAVRRRISQRAASTLVVLASIWPLFASQWRGANLAQQVTRSDVTMTLAFGSIYGGWTFQAECALVLRMVWPSIWALLLQLHVGAWCFLLPLLTTSCFFIYTIVCANNDGPWYNPAHEAWSRYELVLACLALFVALASAANNVWFQERYMRLAFVRQQRLALLSEERDQLKLRSIEEAKQLVESDRAFVAMVRDPSRRAKAYALSARSLLPSAQSAL